MSVQDDNVSTLLQRVMSRVPEPAERVAPQPVPVASESDAFENDVDPNWELQGIGGQTRLTTVFGKVPAHLVRKGDMVRTRRGRFVPVLDIREVKLDLEYVELHPEATPVVIPRGALGANLPMQDVELSSGQLVAMGGTRVQPEIVEARDVARGRRAVDPTLGLVAYYQFLLEEPDEIECDGLWVRSASLNQA